MPLIVQPYKKSIFEVGLPDEQVNIIWDFYVTKSFSKSASQQRKASDYGLQKLPFDRMLQIAGIIEENYKILKCDSIKQSLSIMDLDIGNDQNPVAIEIEQPRMVCIQPYRIEDDNPPKEQMGKAECVFTHIRNAFAHGNTYFFDNGFILLEDKNQGKPTARILIRQQTLLDWVALIDHEERFYIFRQVE